MNERPIIQSAYEAQITGLYNTFRDKFISAKTDAEIDEAETMFANGVTLARKIRNRALAVLPAE